MNLRAWVTAFRDAFRSMTQSSLMSLASVATVAVSLLVLSAVLLLAINLEHMASTLEQQVQINVFLCSAKDEAKPCNKQELKEEQKSAIVDQIQKLPGVKKVTYVTRDEAMQRMKTNFGEQKGILDALEGDNPLRDAVEVMAIDANQVKIIAEATRQLDGVADVNYGKDYVDKLLAFTKAVRLGGIGLVFLLIFATVLTISNTIRLAVYARRREVSIMKLVGATDWFIRRPFMLEGIFLGVFGAAVAMGIVGFGYQRVVLYLNTEIAFLPVVGPEKILLDLTFGLIGLGGVLGAVGSFISLRRFLKV
jgi:cell division transport system permease protein